LEEAEVAAELHAARFLPINYAETLSASTKPVKRCSTRARTQTSRGQSLEDIASTVESAVDQAEQAVAE
jgi:hypothetical protein